MISFDKLEIRKQIAIEQVFELLSDFGAEPEYQKDDTIVARTICHNHPTDNCSRKLYFYDNTGLFHCYTGCEEPSFDLFQLVMKVMQIQQNRKLDLNDAVRWVAARFGISGEEVPDEDTDSLDWNYFDSHQRIKSIELKNYDVILKTYDDDILNRLNYNIELQVWEKEGITQEAMERARIGYFPATDQITIPHFDSEGRFIGLRGRSIAQDEVDRFGKYRPMIINRQQYNHPLGMNVYNLNLAKPQIKLFKTAIIFESEKSTLQYASYFGAENDIAVACCGSSISTYQIHQLIQAGASNIVVALDRQFQELNDREHLHLVNNLKRIHSRFKTDVNLSFIFDRNKITAYKASPTDEGPEKFLQLFKERVVL